MKRGDLVIVSLSGDYGKPRPAMIIQSNTTLAVIGSITFCLITSELVSNAQFRIDVEPQASNGLRSRSQIQIDKIFTLPAEKVRGPIGCLDAETLDRVNLSLALHLELIAP